MKLLLILLTTLFAEGNAYYAAGDYAAAADAYTQVIAETPSAEAYYNLGNARFKQGELAQSILAYERALRLKPNYRDAQYNLRFAEAQIIDNMEDNTTFFIANGLKKVRNSLSEVTWTTVSLVLFVLSLVGFLLFALSRSLPLRKTSFYTAILAIIISVVAFANAFSLHQRDTVRSEAVITQGIVNAKSSPDRSGTDLFTLHEGTKVNIRETIGDWCCIYVGSNVGWIRLSHLERI